MDKKIKELLNNGEDFLAREDLSAKLNYLTEKSGLGEIGIGEYVKELEKVLTEAKEYRKAFNDNYK